AAAPDRPRPGSGGIHGARPRRARVHGSAGGVSTVRRTVLHRGREELPDGRDRLHRRPSPIGHDRRAPETPAGRSGRRPRAGAPPRPGSRLEVSSVGCVGWVGSYLTYPPYLTCVTYLAYYSAVVIGVVVVTHGQLATELVNAAEMIVG